MEEALRCLMDMMQRYYQQPVVLLLDEYDIPVQQAWEHGFYEDCIAFMLNFLSAALKTNPSLDFAVLTWVLRIAKESIFSGLNNLGDRRRTAGQFTAPDAGEEHYVHAD